MINMNPMTLVAPSIEFPLINKGICASFVSTVSKIFEAIASFFKNVYESLMEPRGCGIVCFIGSVALGVVFLNLADSDGMQADKNKVWRVLLKITAIAAFILAGAFLASGVIFSIV